MHLYPKGPYEAKYQLLIKKKRKYRIKDPKVFIEYSNDVQDVYKNIEEYNVIKIRKILIAFDAMIADMIHDKNLNPVVTVLFIRGRKLNISSVFTMQSYFIVPKNVRINSTDYFIMKMSSKRELQQIGSNLSLDIDIKDFIKTYKNVLQNHILFWLMIQLYHQIILYDLEKIF